MLHVVTVPGPVSRPPAAWRALLLGSPRGVYNAGVAAPALPLLALAACADWPRFAHLPDDAGGVPAGSEVDVASAVTWTHVGARGDNLDDAPLDAPAESLEAGAGIVVHGLAAGSGWDFDADAERPDDCGAPSGFPSEEAGDYAGDVDWRVVDLAEPGVLCSSLLHLDGVTRADVLVYELDACGVPGEPLRDADGHVLGFGAEAPHNAWSLAIEAPRRLALPAAAWAPDAPDAALRYLWGLALVPLPRDGAGVRCPSVEDL